MSIDLQDLVDTACLLAKADGIKKTAVGELLVPRVLTWVGQRIASDPDRRHLLMANLNLVLVLGSVALPADVLVEHIKHGVLSDPADATFAKKMRWAGSWKEFVRPLDPELGYFAVQASGDHHLLFVTRPGTPYNPVSGMTGPLSLFTSYMPLVVSGTITSPPEVDQDIILALTAALKGDWEPVIAAEGPPK